MILLALIACEAVVDFPPPTTWDSGASPTTTTSEEPLHTPLEWDARCTSEGWSYRLRVEGWVAAATLDLVESGTGARERHSLGRAASDPEGAWDELALGPLPEVPAADQAANTSTRFPCDSPLSMVVRVEDARGELLSCAVAGDDPDAALAAVRTAEPDLQGLRGCTVF